MALKKKAAVKKKPKPSPAKAVKKAKGGTTTAKKAKKVVKASAKKTGKAKTSLATQKTAKGAKPVKGAQSPKSVKSVKPVKKSGAAKPAKEVKTSKAIKVVSKVKADKPPAKAAPTNVKVAQNTKPASKSLSPQTAKASSPAKVGSAKVSPKPQEVNKAKTALKTDPVTTAKGKKPKEETVDPLHAKAEKVMRELEETMDLSKMRPRIQALTTAPKPLPKAAPAPLRLPEPANTTKVKFQLEFEFRSSPKILFASISDSSGLAGWFADEVITNDDVYTFIWEGSESHAKLVALRELQLVRFQWLDENDGTYFQFEIKEDDITSDIALMITDFANPGEKETTIRLWESQIQKLRMLLGSL